MRASPTGTKSSLVLRRAAAVLHDTGTAARGLGGGGGQGRGRLPGQEGSIMKTAAGSVLNLSVGKIALSTPALPSDLRLGTFRQTVPASPLQDSTPVQSLSHQVDAFLKARLVRAESPSGKKILAAQLKRQRLESRKLQGNPQGLAYKKANHGNPASSSERSGAERMPTAAENKTTSN